MANPPCAVCEDPVGDDYVEIDEDALLEDRNGDEEAWVAHSDCWRRHQASLEQMRRMFETLERDDEAHTDVEGVSYNAVDEDELDEEIADIEETLNESLDAVGNDGA